MPCAWPVTDDMKNPAHYPLATDKACYVGDGVAAVLATSESAARDAIDLVDVTYEPLEAVIDLEDALSDRVVIHEDLGTNRSYTWALKVEGSEGQIDAAFADAAHTVKERYVQQRLIPMAHGDPGRRRRSPTVRWRRHALLDDADPAHPQDHVGDHARPRRAPGARRRPGRRWWLRVEAQRLRRGAAVHGARQEARRARALERDTHRERAGDDPRPRPDPGHRARRRRRRQGDGGTHPPARRHGRLPPARHARHPPARSVPLRRRVRPPRRLRLRVHVGVHDDDAHRRLPRRRPSRGDVRHRAGDGRPRRQDRVSIRSSCAGATTSRPRPTRTRRGAGSSTTPPTTPPRPTRRQR